MIDSSRLIVVFIAVMIILVIVMAISSVLLSAELESQYAEQGCALTRNMSQSRESTHTTYIPASFKPIILIPVNTQTTEYHSYLVCQNGTVFDYGWR